MKLSKAIGGFFELELPTNKSSIFHTSMYAINSGRNALLMLLKAKGYTKIHLPYYTCGVIIDTLKNANININYYHIDKDLEIVNLPSNTNEIILYNNYFGIKNKYIYKLSLQYPNIIVDNAQAFYSKPINNLDTFYSPRKFFGLPDGGFLYSKHSINTKEYPIDSSYDRCSHLLKRIDLEPENAYLNFQENDSKLENQPIKRMSNLTRTLFNKIQHNEIEHRRMENFNFIHKKLQGFNELSFDIELDAVPMIYPLLVKKGRLLKTKLIEKRIFIATYWSDVLERVSKGSYEEYLVNNLVALPIDQRYNLEDMEQIINVLNF